MGPEELADMCSALSSSENVSGSVLPRRPLLKMDRLLTT